MNLWTTRRKPVDDGRKHTLTCYDARCNRKRSPGAVLGRSGSTGDLTDMEVSAMTNPTPNQAPPAGGG